MYKRSDEIRKMGLENKLIYAVATNDLEAIKEMLIGISHRQLNMKYALYDTSLLLAANDNNIEVTKLLLHAGANTEIKDLERCTPLAVALKNGYEELAYLLMEYGANIFHESNRKISILHYAAVACGKAMIEYLLNKGLDINFLSSDKLSALDFTTDIHTKGNINAAKTLVDNGINHDIITKSFNRACWRGNDSIAKLLINSGADISSVLGQNRTNPEILFWLCKTPIRKQRTRNLKVIRLLLTHGIDFNIRYKLIGSIISYTGSPLQMAKEERFFDAVNLIKEGEW